MFLSGPSDALIPRLTGVESGVGSDAGVLDCASAKPAKPNCAAVIVMTAVPKKLRRDCLTTSLICFPNSSDIGGPRLDRLFFLTLRDHRFLEPIFEARRSNLRTLSGKQ